MGGRNEKYYDDNVTFLSQFWNMQLRQVTKYIIKRASISSYLSSISKKHMTGPQNLGTNKIKETPRDLRPKKIG